MPAVIALVVVTSEEMSWSSRFSMICVYCCISNALGHILLPAADGGVKGV